MDLHMCVPLGCFSWPTKSSKGGGLNN